MGQHGQLVFFTGTRPENPVAAWEKTLALTGASTVLFVSRSHQPHNAWQRALASISRPSYGVQPVVYEEDMLLERAPIEQARSAYIEGLHHTAQLYTTAPGLLIGQGISRDIPESIRADFIPADMIPKIGPHDIFEFAEHERGHYFGRAWWSVFFFSYGTPRNWKEFRRRVFDVPEVKQVKAQLEEIAGPLEQCVYWSV